MTQTIRPDVDIEEDVRALIAHYPPLQADRHQVRTRVNDGVVTVEGHVRSVISQRYLLDRIPMIAGVKAVDASGLYNEEAIRLEAGQRIPSGVLANAVYSAVVLTGKLPDGTSAESVVEAVSQIPGVMRVITKF
jgi:osmotically-inducible protein OsmY